MYQLILNFAEGRRWVRQDMYAAEAQVPCVPDHIKERHRAGPALCRVHPVAHPGILRHIALTAKPDVEAIEGVVADGNPNPEELQKKDERHATQELNLLCVGARAFGGKRV